MKIICPVCKGRRGHHFGGPMGVPCKQNWLDCYECDGEGFIIKKKPTKAETDEARKIVQLLKENEMKVNTLPQGWGLERK